MSDSTEPSFKPWRIRDAYPYTEADLAKMAADAEEAMQDTQAFPMQDTASFGMDTSGSHYPY